jgi:hypothetical protein
MTLRASFKVLLAMLTLILQAMWIECQGRLRIPHFRRIKNPQFSILEKGSRIVSNAENGGMAIDTRFVFTRLEHQ